MVGDKDFFWQSAEGKIWGGGGISGGLSIKRYFLKKSYLNLEIRYTQKGSVYEYLNSFSIPNLDIIRINYLEVPLLGGTDFYVNNKIFFLKQVWGLPNTFLRTQKL